MHDRDDGSERPLSAPPSLVGRDILVLSPTPTGTLDAGNRKRVHAVCRAFQQRGARIHFIYYPFEWWYTAVPQAHIDAMAAQWDAFYLTPVTRPLQAPPAGDHHTIDEWWDPAIEPLLHWILQRGRFDAFIVNYPFLSRALDFAPSGTLRILDTHDRFAGRKELLARMDIGPEYFYTTEEEEAKALRRADLVWAIKDEEAEWFRRIETRPVITMPHCEDRLSMPQRSLHPDDDLVLGMVGARNSLNLRNATQFIEKVLPVLRRRLAPVRVRFGGGMCEDLKKMVPLPAGVELAGRFDEPEEFYGTVDAVVVPMTTSTGLKIKAVEAFALGLPVIAHSHAVEGIPVSHPFHRCDSLEQVAECCLALAADHSLLSPLRQATVRTHAQLASAMTRAVDETIRQIAAPLTIVLAVAPEFGDADSVYGQHVLETIEYVKHLCPIILYADRPLQGGFTTWCQRFLYRSTSLKLVLSPSAATTMGFDADRRRSPPFPLFHSVETLHDLLLRLPRRLLWLADLPEEVLGGCLPPPLVAHSYVRVDACRLLDRWSESAMAEALSGMPGAVPVSWSLSSEDPAVPADLASRGQRIPFWREVRGNSWAPWHGDASRAPETWVTVAVDRPDAALAWARTIRELEPSLLAIRLLFPSRSSLRDASSWLQDCLDARGDTVQNAVEKLMLRRHKPLLVLDAAAREAEFSVLHETAVRLGVPWLTAWRRGGCGAIQGMLERSSSPLTIGELVSRIDAALHRSREELPAEGDPAFSNDAGWQWIWKSVSFRKSMAL